MFFHEGVFPSQQSGFRHFCVLFDRRGDDDALDRLIDKYFIERPGRHAIGRGNSPCRILVSITNTGKRIQFVEISDKVSPQ